MLGFVFGFVCFVFLFVLFGVVFGALVCSVSFCVLDDRDSIQDYVSVLHQFTFAATLQKRLTHDLINQLIPIATWSQTCWTTWRKPWRRWTEKNLWVLLNSTGDQLETCPNCRPASKIVAPEYVILIQDNSNFCNPGGSWHACSRTIEPDKFPNAIISFSDHKWSKTQCCGEAVKHSLPPTASST